MILGFDDKKSKKIEFLVEPNSGAHYKIIDCKTYGQHLAKMNLNRVGNSIDSLVQCPSHDFAM